MRTAVLLAEEVGACSRECAQFIIDVGRRGNLKRIHSDSDEDIVNGIPDSVFTDVRGITGGQRVCGSCRKEDKEGALSWILGGENKLVSLMKEVLAAEDPAVTIDAFIAEANAAMAVQYQKALAAIARDNK